MEIVNTHECNVVRDVEFLALDGMDNASRDIIICRQDCGHVVPGSEQRAGQFRSHFAFILSPQDQLRIN